MSDLKLFRVLGGRAIELTGASLALEKQLQGFMEANMEALFGVRFVASEYSTSGTHRGRIDSLGLDRKGAPVIFEYKRRSSQNVINQGLSYLDWLVDHRADFEALVRRVLGPDAAGAVDWSKPRVICVARSFSPNDERAVRQIDRSVELVRYCDFDGELLTLEV